MRNESRFLLCRAGRLIQRRLEYRAAGNPLKLGHAEAIGTNLYSPNPVTIFAGQVVCIEVLKQKPQLIGLRAEIGRQSAHGGEVMDDAVLAARSQPNAL